MEGGKGIRQTCFVIEGDPPLLVSWFRDGQDLENDESVRVTRIDALTSMLAISDLTSAHSGNYTCVAKNEVAAVAETAMLLVKGSQIQSGVVRKLSALQKFIQIDKVHFESGNSKFL